MIVKKRLKQLLRKGSILILGLLGKIVIVLMILRPKCVENSFFLTFGEIWYSINHCEGDAFYEKVGSYC